MRPELWKLQNMSSVVLYLKQRIFQCIYKNMQQRMCYIQLKFGGKVSAIQYHWLSRRPNLAPNKAGPFGRWYWAKYIGQPCDAKESM